ncbi:MAG: chloride channel protein [Gammaproteobacteria bacterium]|nr:chloride channel protein [Gammaproteobacteria bacterium]
MYLKPVLKSIKRQIRRSRSRLFSFRQWKIRLVFWGGALTVGVVSSLFAIGSEHAEHFFRQLLTFSPYLPLLLTPLGLIAVSWITRRYFAGAEGSGIPQSIAAMQVGGSHTAQRAILSIRIALGKILLTIVGLMSGASIGREGPTVHIGAAIMYSLGHLGRFPSHYLERGMILAGGASGIAAAFNTPLAGIMFAVEEMGRSFDKRTGSIVLTAVVLSGLTSLAILGNYNYFGSTSVSLELGHAWLAVPVCGVVGGLLGGLFSSGLINGQKRIRPLYLKHPFIVAGTCGLIIAILGLISGSSSYGTGYEEAKLILAGDNDLPLLYPLWKALATLSSYFSGIPGGIFAPSLATGAGIGAILSHALTSIPMEAVIILGMVAYFSGVVQTPITAFIIVMEMTDNQSLIIPLMATSLIASGTARLVCSTPIYQAMAETFIQSMKTTK